MLRWKQWLLRRRRKVWAGLAGVVVVGWLVGWFVPLDQHFAHLDTCPACYGHLLCPALLHHDYAGNNGKRITLSGYTSWKVGKLLNVKNVYYGRRGDDWVVVKKLAHDSELRELDQTLCQANKQEDDCSVGAAMTSLMAKSGHDLSLMVSRYPQLFGRSDGVRCNHNTTLQHLYHSFTRLDNGPHSHHHFLTLLAVNMEPLIQNAYGSQWFPRLLGQCGRLVVSQYVGPTLTQLGRSEPWLVRADYARQLLQMAAEFSRGMTFRLYLTDVSLDNFAVDEAGQVKLVDAENIVMVDPSFPGLDTSEHINEGYGCWDCLSFSYEDLCGHTQADHNYYAICKGMLSSKCFSRDLPEGLLHDPPAWVVEEEGAGPPLSQLVEDCARHFSPSWQGEEPRRHHAAQALLSRLTSILHQAKQQGW